MSLPPLVEVQQLNEILEGTGVTCHGKAAWARVGSRVSDESGASFKLFRWITGVRPCMETTMV